MTVEKRTLIGLGDVLAIEYECTNCHTRHSVPLSEIKAINMRCMNCPQQFANMEHIGNKESDQAVLVAFIAYLKEVQQRNFQAIIRMEVTNLSDKQSQ